MKMDWNKFLGNTLNVTLNENYGLTLDSGGSPFYEIVFQTGKLIEAFEDGLLLEAEREGHQLNIYIPFNSIKCVEIFKM
jgi:hypothetical protein